MLAGEERAYFIGLKGDNWLAVPPGSR
jgi:hypothetical protein